MSHIEVYSNGIKLVHTQDYHECVATRWINHTVVKLNLVDQYRLKTWITLEDQYKNHGHLELKMPG